MVIDIGRSNLKNWIIGNIRNKGMYRVNYDNDNWDLLIEQLNNKNEYEMIHVINRAQLVEDSFYLGKAELIDQVTFLRLANYLKNEKNVIPFMAADLGLTYIKQMFLSNPVALNSLGVNILFKKAKHICSSKKFIFFLLIRRFKKDFIHNYIEQTVGIVNYET